MATRSEVMLKFRAEVALGATIELVALATHGSVSKAKVSASAATYSFEEKQHEFTVTVKSSKQHSAETFRAEVIHMLCALMLIGTDSLDASGFTKNDQMDEVLNWLSAQNISPLSFGEPIDDNTNLTLDDLENIWRALVPLQRSVDTIMLDTEYTGLFPYADLVAGRYERLRHCSGSEISLETRQDASIISHRIDAPNPVTTLVADLNDTKELAVAGKGRQFNPTKSIFDPDGYRGSNESRWRVSKMLGAVPRQHKEEVFRWAANVINTVDEFHNTHGGVALPKSFEYRYDDVLLTADTTLKFEKGNLPCK